jgi:hypothetical protein
MFNVDQLRHEIEALVRDYPDLAEDDVLRADMLDGETEITGVLTALVKAERTNKRMVELPRKSWLTSGLARPVRTPR